MYNPKDLSVMLQSARMKIEYYPDSGFSKCISSPMTLYKYLFIRPSDEKGRHLYPYARADGSMILWVHTPNILAQNSLSFRADDTRKNYISQDTIKLSIVLF